MRVWDKKGLNAFGALRSNPNSRVQMDLREEEKKRQFKKLHLKLKKRETKDKRKAE